MPTWLRCIVCLAAVVLLAPGCENKAPASRPRPGLLMVFAAASTSEVITEAAQRYQRTRGTQVTTSFGGSSTLAKQIKAGAAADVFISADQDWMDDLAKAGAIDAASRADLLSNSLVLVAPKGKGFSVTMSKEFGFAALFQAPKRIAVADPEHVPAGRYAKQSLESLGWWAGVKDRMVPAQDVRAALRLVEMGEADAGIVYSTDTATSGKIEVVATFPEETHEPIRYPLAATAKAGPEARAFIEFLRSPEMVEVYKGRGFGVVGGECGGGGNR